MHKILIVDDEEGVRVILKDYLSECGYHVSTAEDGLAGLNALKENTFDLVILDVRLPKVGGIEILQQIKKLYPLTEVIMVSGNANINLAVKAVKIGAFDFLEKPVSLDKISTLIKNAIEMHKLKTENKVLKAKIFIEDELVGKSSKMLKVKELIDQSAKSDARILITGENGTGKELIAKDIHQKSLRADNPFIEVNCAAIPETLIESELFGHEKGAFTNAVSRRTGKFELAHTGTLFLDEVADMSLNAQAKVLRVIQELRFERIGGEESISVDVRIIAATNKNIQEQIAKGKFREDLFFRLNVIPIEAPPLRDRENDILLLIDYFLQKHCNSNNLKQKKKFSAECINMLKKYDWPGNIRQLKNFIDRINIMTDKEEIDSDTALKFLDKKQDDKANDLGIDFSKLKLNEAKEIFEAKFIDMRLRNNDYNISKTAVDLGVHPSNLYGKIKRFNIELKK